MGQSLLVTTLNQIVSDYGIEILKDGKRVIAMFSDYRPDGRAEKNKLRIAFEFDVFEQLMKAPSDVVGISIACNKAIEALKEQAFIEKQVATSIVCDIADVLNLKYDLTMQSVSNKNVASVITTTKTADSYKNLPHQNTELSLKPSKTVFVEREMKKNNCVLSTWHPGSGIGYSTHNNPVFPMQAYQDLKDQITIEVPLSYKMFHPLGLLVQCIRLRRKYKIACEWHKAKQYCNLYDAYRVDGVGFNPTAMKYKKYNEKYLKKLERKFWS